jgi:hypothetical protein
MAGTPITNANIQSTLKPTLDIVWGDQTKGKLDWEECGFKVSNTTDAYIDDQEFAHTGIMPPKAQGQMMAIDSIQQGYLRRYWMVTYGLRMVVSEEALADCKYDEAIAGTKSIARSGKLTQEYQAAGIFVNAASSSYTGADGVSLANSAHPLPKGGTASNTLSTPMSLSETAVETMWAAMQHLPGSNGYQQAGYELKRLVVPKELWFRANRILKSEQQNDTNNNAINVLKGMGIEIGSNRYVTSTTNWSGVSDLEAGLRFVWREKLKFRDHNVEDNMTMVFSGYQRFAVGWSDWRDFYFSNI